MGAVIVIVLFIIAIALFFARQHNYITNETLQTIATIIAIISGLAAIFVFIIPQAIPVESNPRENLSVTVSDIPEPTEAPIEPTQAPADPAVAPAEPTEVPPPVTSTLTIGSTMPGQDGMTLLYVPAGEFLRGSKEDDSDADDNEKPQRSIYLDAFWIDETEVTNKMFTRFVDQTGYQTDAEKETRGAVLTRTGWEWIDGADWQHPQGPNSDIEGLEEHPVVQVSWNDASAYCEWAGRRLPTEAEWEKAARGTEGQTHPWGDEPPTCDLLQYGPCEGRTVPVGSYLAGASPYDALDMAGNVWEWAADRYDAEYYKDAPERNPQGPDTGEFRVLRGSSWVIEARWVRAGFRVGDDPAGRIDLVGFRCAVSSP